MKSRPGSERVKPIKSPTGFSYSGRKTNCRLGKALSGRTRPPDGRHSRFSFGMRQKHKNMTGTRRFFSCHPRRSGAGQGNLSRRAHVSATERRRRHFPMQNRSSINESPASQFRTDAEACPGLRRVLPSRALPACHALSARRPRRLRVTAGQRAARRRQSPAICRSPQRCRRTPRSMPAA